MINTSTVEVDSGIVGKVDVVMAILVAESLYENVFRGWSIDQVHS